MRPGQAERRSYDYNRQTAGALLMRRSKTPENAAATYSAPSQAPPAQSGQQDAAVNAAKSPPGSQPEVAAARRHSFGAAKDSGEGADNGARKSAGRRQRGGGLIRPRYRREAGTRLA